MEQNPDNNDDDDDGYYTDRRFSFAPAPPQKRISLEKPEDMQDLKAKLKEEMMK